jgi:hypothetical protein
LVLGADRQYPAWIELQLTATDSGWLKGPNTT